ncbi:hypothetical protein [Psychromicrobium xiongbiense]|uniref:hypothetical protein n=1 Tax=Psychromicrobium xiongbiense TaxID=3051184 RepID=UPI002556ACAD|nr:hypothetical protein [Psychromicrobium sp. YIM S02556]
MVTWIIVIGIVIVGVIVIVWAARGGRSYDPGLSDADRYLQILHGKEQEQRAQALNRVHTLRVGTQSTIKPYQAQQGQSYPSQSYAQPQQPGGYPAQPQQPAIIPPQLTPELLTAAQTMIRQGHKIQAIALVRKVTGADLRSAKDLVDRMS